MSGATTGWRSPPRRWRRAPRPTRAGGWRLSGRSPSSGCDYAQWAILGAFLGEMGDTRRSPTCWCHSDIEIVDDWQVLGLAGTGSKLLLHDVFIPEHRLAASSSSDLFEARTRGAQVHPDYPVV